MDPSVARTTLRMTRRAHIQILMSDGGEIDTQVEDYDPLLTAANIGLSTDDIDNPEKCYSHQDVVLIQVRPNCSCRTCQTWNAFNERLGELLKREPGGRANAARADELWRLAKCSKCFADALQARDTELAELGEGR